MASSLPPGIDRKLVYEAAFDYAKVRDDELSIQKGERFLALDLHDPHWWNVQRIVGGRLADAKGMVPSNFLKPFVDSTSAKTSYVPEVSAGNKKASLATGQSTYATLSGEQSMYVSTSLHEPGLYTAPVDKTYAEIDAVKTSIKPSHTYARLDGTQDMYNEYELYQSSDVNWKKKSQEMQTTVKDFTKEQAEALLTKNGLKRGTYVIRKSMSHPGSFVLVHCGSDAKIRNYPIELCSDRSAGEAGVFTLLSPGDSSMRHRFQGLQEVLAHYQVLKEGIECVIVKRIG